MKTFLLKEITVFSNWKSMFLEMEARLMASTKPHTAHSLIIPYPRSSLSQNRSANANYSPRTHKHTHFNHSLVDNETGNGLKRTHMGPTPEIFRLNA